MVTNRYMKHVLNIAVDGSTKSHNSLASFVKYNFLFFVIERVNLHKGE
jgi:hypothetical protein